MRLVPPSTVLRICHTGSRRGSLEPYLHHIVPLEQLVPNPQISFGLQTESNTHSFAGFELQSIGIIAGYLDGYGIADFPAGRMNRIDP
jgi:hypothetical protein